MSSCYNFDCTNLKPEMLRKGWRLHSGDCADLCDRCASTCEEGRFCETFHSNIAGWRKCESCGKGVHCGCISSAHVYVLLDPGGVQCLTCARKNISVAYFPSISQSEGLPLKVQDAKGKEWIFHFRFWPNNNSRMYVLEGVTPCIQAMQLQAGDIVTFSRLEPEGKLVMGFRKTSATPSDQDSETTRSGNGIATHGDVEFSDPSSWSKVDKSGYIAREALGAKSSGPRKRKNTALSLKSKHLRFDNEDLIELRLTWEEAQGLLRPPPNHIPTVVVIEGFEFEEYEDAPVLGKPTILGADNTG